MQWQWHYTKLGGKMVFPKNSAIFKKGVAKRGECVMSKLKIFVASLMTIASLAVTPTTYASGGGSSHGQPAVTASHHRPPLLPPDPINGHSVIWSDNSSATSTGSIG